MIRYLLDTGAASDYINRRRGVDQRVREAVSRGNRVGICFPVLGELHAGLELSTSRERNLERMRHALARLACWPLDVKAAQEYGRVFASLRRAGHTIQQVDMQIAAIALSLGNTVVVSSDSDLTAVSGLTVENWATPVL